MDLTKYQPKKPLMPSLFSGVKNVTIPGITRPAVPAVTQPVTATPTVTQPPVATTPKPTQGSAPVTQTPMVPSVNQNTPSIQSIMEGLKGISSTLGTMKDDPAPGTTPVKPELSEEEKTITSLMNPTSEELTTQADLDKLIESTKSGYLNTENKAIPMEFITGQMAAIEKRATNLAEPLERKLARMQAQRTSALEASKFALERSDKKASTEADQKYKADTFAESKRKTDLDYKLSQEKFEEDKRQFGLNYAQNARKIALDESKVASEQAANTPDQAKAQQQVAFLKKTAQDAKDLAGAAGRSGIRRTAEGLLVGATDYTQLESLTNTLKTNMLTLATDPTVKKFFGPQMSNADVELMMSGGTTLNPEKNRPEQMKTELNRVLDLFNRMEQSIGGGSAESAPQTMILNGKTLYLQADGTYE